MKVTHLLVAAFFVGCTDQASIDTITAPPYTDEEFEMNGDHAYHRYSFEMHILPRKGGDTIIEKGATCEPFARLVAYAI